MEIPDYLHSRVAEIIAINFDEAERSRTWVAVLGLKPFRDGNKYCFLWGPNIQDGVCGFGETPEKAVYAFEEEMFKKAPQ